jgi:hypothetical protein
MKDERHHHEHCLSPHQGLVFALPPGQIWHKGKRQPISRTNIAEEKHINGWFSLDLERHLNLPLI